MKKENNHREVNIDYNLVYKLEKSFTEEATCVPTNFGLPSTLSLKLDRLIRYHDIEDIIVKGRSHHYIENGHVTSLKEINSKQIENTLFDFKNSYIILSYIVKTKSKTALKRYLTNYGKYFFTEIDYFTIFSKLFDESLSHNPIGKDYIVNKPSDLWEALFEFMIECQLNQDVEWRIAHILSMYLNALPSRDKGIRKILLQGSTTSVVVLVSFLSQSEIQYYIKYAIENRLENTILNLAIALYGKDSVKELAHIIVASENLNYIAMFILNQFGGVPEYLLSTLLNNSNIKKYIYIAKILKKYDKDLTNQLIEYFINNKSKEDIIYKESIVDIMTSLISLPACKLSMELAKEVITTVESPLMIAIFINTLGGELKEYAMNIVKILREDDCETIFKITDNIEPKELSNDMENDTKKLKQKHK